MSSFLSGMPMLRAALRLWPMLLCLVLVAFYSQTHKPTPRQTGNPTVLVVGGSSMSGNVGSSGSLSLSASPSGGPIQGSECTATGVKPGPWSGPSWSWSATPSSSGITASVTPQSGSSSVSLNVSYLQPGDYTVTVTASVSYSSNCGSKSGSGSKTISVHVDPKVWDIGTAISGGTVAPTSSSTTPITITAGGNVSVSVTGASDSDHWTLGPQSGTDADTLTYSWASDMGGTFASPTSASTTWTPAPSGIVGTQDGTLTCTIDDTPKAKGAGETGTRDDKAVTKTVSVRLQRKVWDVGTPISGGDVTSPADTLSVVRPGQSLTCSVGTASDSDHWTQGATEGTEADTITYAWSSDLDGTFDSPTSASTKWTPSPLSSAIGSITGTLTCKIDDTPKAIGTGETGKRDDTGLTKTISVKVARKMWSAGTGLSGNTTLTINGAPAPVVLYVDQGQSVTFSMPTVTDSDHWIDNFDGSEGDEADTVEYRWSDGTQGQTLTWTAPPITTPGVGSVSGLYTFSCRAFDTPKLPGEGEGGTRKDSKDLSSQIVSVTVVRKMWNPSPAIGQHPGAGGTGWADDGRIQTPVAGQEVPVNGQVKCSVEEAHDYDSWSKEPSSTGVEEDGAVSYTWSAGTGGFLVTGPDGKPSVQNTATGRTAIWVAPSTAIAGAKIECKLDNSATTKAVPSPQEGGKRTESSVTRSVTVQVVQKVWDAGDAITGGDIVKPALAQNDAAHPLVVEQNSTIDLAMADGHDSDRWTMGAKEGTDDDTPKYSWKVGAEQGTFSSTDGQSTKWTAPSLPGGADSIDFTLSGIVDDLPKDPGQGEGGTRDDQGAALSKHDLYISVRRPSWKATPDIGQHRDPDTNQLVPDGRMIAPQDQRGNTNSSQPQAIISGARVPCKVEAATDLDTLTAIDSTTSESQDEVNYTWSVERSGGQGSDKGQFEWQGTDANGQPITKTGQTAPTTEAVWVAPSDVTKDTQFTLKCTVDDKPTPVDSPTEGGTRDDKALERTVTLKGQDFKVTFDGLARACAGGIGVDGVHSFTLIGTANKADGSLAINTQFKLSFDGNKGHDYSGDDPALWPSASWTIDQMKKAKFVTTDASGNQTLTETMNITTDAQGKLSVTVLSSDIVSSDIKIKVKATNAQGADTDAGSQACDFGKTESKRLFPHFSDPNDDNGWIIDFPNLGASGNWTPAKVYLKFKPDTTTDDTPPNWRAANGHRVRIKIKEVRLRDGSTVTDSNAIKNYVILTNAPPDQAQSGDTYLIMITSGDGGAQVWLKAHDQIGQAIGVTLEPEDLSRF